MDEKEEIDSALEKSKSPNICPFNWETQMVTTFLLKLNCREGNWHTQWTHWDQKL